ncbi:hypothetical protein F5X96DRAFT_666460 [Biscogniauxia mediterranea]|nr:hypothetical protein F5X96DRAFT_666460 [Biscogniauxia mediterranea]
MFHYTIITLLSILGVFHGVNSQGFITNCTWQTSLLQDSWLGMYCNNDDWRDFAYDWTWVDTNLCLINNGGQLIPYDKYV